MRDLQPKKWPRQARSRATFDALVEACARLLAERPFASVSTNHIAARAGVSVGSLYEFFPNREAILFVLTQRRLAALRADVEAAIEEATALPDWDATRLLVERILTRVTADRELFRVLLREAPFVRERPETQRGIAELMGLGALARRRSGRLARFPHPEIDGWLVGRMLASAVLDVAFADRRGDRALLAEELARLVYRMVRGRDPERAR